MRADAVLHVLEDLFGSLAFPKANDGACYAVRSEVDDSTTPIWSRVL
jgi:hypothetical protein